MVAINIFSSSYDVSTTCSMSGLPVVTCSIYSPLLTCCCSPALAINTPYCSLGQNVSAGSNPYPIPELTTSMESTTPSTMFGLNLAPLPSGSLHVNCALTDASALTPDPFLFINTPSICPMSSIIGSAFTGLVDCKLSHTISGKHGFLFRILLAHCTADDAMLPAES